MVGGENVRVLAISEIILPAESLVTNGDAAGRHSLWNSCVKGLLAVYIDVDRGLAEDAGDMAVRLAFKFHHCPAQRASLGAQCVADNREIAAPNFGTKRNLSFPGFGCC